MLVGTDDEAEPLTIKEIATSVDRALRGAEISGLESDEVVDAALRRQANILAEVAALFVALRELPTEAKATIVHDFVGVRDWMEGVTRAPKDPAVEALLLKCDDLRDQKRLQLEFMHQPGHRST